MAEIVTGWQPEKDTSMTDTDSMIEMGDELRVDVGPAAASIAEMVTELVDTATTYSRDWRPTLAAFVQLRLERLGLDPSPTNTKTTT